MNEERKQLRAPVEADVDVERTSPSLVEEILATTRQAQALGLVDWSDAIDRAEGRAKAISALARAAISETEPHQWTRFQSKDGADRLRPKVGAAMTINTYFQISAKWSKPIIQGEGEDQFVLVTGVARCGVTDVEVPIRAKRFRKEDFVGRKTYERDGKTVGIDVGVEDVIDSTISLFLTKCAIMLSGIHSISPAKAATIWGITEAQVLADCDGGHGARPPKDANGKAPAGGARVMTEPQARMLWARANSRIEKLGADMDPDALVDEAIVQICGTGVTKDTAPIGKVTPMVKYIDAWGNDQAKPKANGSRDPHPDDEVFD
uniref:Uncharacterized protein n=1 Tax=viral metagenome TaxID=1070528 RepID=A0A6M3JCP7_9ZZZZ